MIRYHPRLLLRRRTQLEDYGTRLRRWERPGRSVQRSLEVAIYETPRAHVIARTLSQLEVA